MLRYPCLILDHDDTAVDSTATVHYPCFVSYCEEYAGGYSCTLEHYIARNFDPGVIAFFRDEVGMSEEQMLHEQAYWKDYVRGHVPAAYPGIREVLRTFVGLGGKLCVVSHSYRENILRDYRENGLPEPLAVYGWECPRERRKPSPWAVGEIMRDLGVSREEILVVDDLKPGYDMARAAGVDFACAGWSGRVPEIERFMRATGCRYLERVEDLGAFLFGEEGQAGGE